MLTTLTHNRYDLCCIGHITKDVVITPKTTVHMPGGTAFYFSSALSRMNTRYLLVTALAESENESVRRLQAKGIAVKVLPSAHTVYFENRYGRNSDHRTQRVLQQADAFRPEDFLHLHAGIFHLGPLLAGDIPGEGIRALAAIGKVSLDVQGFLRTVRNNKVYPANWTAKEYLLPYVHFLKVNENELRVLTGCAHIEQGAKMIAGWGVQEVIITLGSKGSVVYHNGCFYSIPAYAPHRTVDATGCGDTYMAGYLYRRSKGASIQQAGAFAAAMATLKIEASGPFCGTEKEVEAVMQKGKVLSVGTVDVRASLHC